jgi:alanyl-tRNA synthetase
MDLECAKRSGALSFFAEKYEDRVRVVSIGEYSKELCAGIHLDMTGQIGLFKIISESSVASGIRRIEAATGKYAYRRIQEEEILISELVRQFKVPQNELIKEIENKLNYIKKLERELMSTKLKIFESNLPQFLDKITIFQGIKLLVTDVEIQDIQYMRKIQDILRNKISPPYIIFLFNKSCGDGLFIISISEDLIKNGYDARKILDTLKLKGGGRANLIQGGMKNKDWKTKREKWEEFFDNPEKIKEIIINTL